MKIDLHTHSLTGSPCSQLTVDEIVEEARAHLDAVCLTDHGSVDGAERAESLSRETGFPVFIGVEAWCHEGHFLVFTTGEPPTDGPYTLNQLAEMLQDDEHVIIPAHTYRGGWGEDAARIVRTNRDLFAAIEVYNNNCGYYDVLNNLHLAEELDLPGVGCSDAHGPGVVGVNYTDFEDTIASVADMVRAVKSGRFTPVQGCRETG